VAIGRHPHESKDFEEPALAELASLAEHPKVRAIGEAGLDYHRDYAPREDQRRAFEYQLGLAQDLHLPLVVHTRDAAEDTFELLERGGGHGIPIIMHCFSMSDRVDECIEYGYYCSFAGNVTYPNASDLQRAAEKVPDELLLVETDAPFLAPQEYRGRHNEPAFVRSTAAFLAGIRGQSYEQLENVVRSNAEWIFRW
jgi:TatD DNase family protein